MQANKYDAKKMWKINNYFDKFANQVFLEHVGGLDCVWLLDEGVGRIAAAVLKHDLIATRVVLDKVGQIVYFVQDDHPARFDGAVGGHVFECVLV